MNIVDQCPISTETLDETPTRFIAAFVLVIILAYLASGRIAFPVFLAADFSLRAFGGRRFSPLWAAAGGITTGIGLKKRMVNAGPKLFAAKMGAYVSGLTAILQVLHFQVGAISLAVALAACATLQALASICIGCKLYSMTSLVTSRQRPRR